MRRHCKGIAVDSKYEEQLPKTIPMALFFGDDDYEKDLEKYQALFAPFQMDLLMGFYHFLGYENMLRESFKTIHESEDYDEVICHTDSAYHCFSDGGSSKPSKRRTSCLFAAS